MRETRLRTRARARVRRPVNPSRAETISPWKTGFSAPYPEVFAPTAAPQAPFLPRWRPFPRKNRPENPAPGPECRRKPGFSARIGAALSDTPPGFRRGRCASAVRSARVSAVPAAACPDRHTDGLTHAPVFRPAAPAPARPTHRPGATARLRPASGPPRHRLQRFALVKGCVTPRGDQIPGLFGWRPRPTLA